MVKCFRTLCSPLSRCLRPQRILMKRVNTPSTSTNSGSNNQSSQHMYQTHPMPTHQDSESRALPHPFLEKRRIAANISHPLADLFDEKEIGAHLTREMEDLEDLSPSWEDSKHPDLNHLDHSLAALPSKECPRVSPLPQAISQLVRYYIPRSRWP